MKATKTEKRTARTPAKAKARRPPKPVKARASGKSEGTLTVVQVHSGIGCTERQRAVLRSLGLRGPHDRKSLPDRPSVRGMVAAVPHLVRLEPATGRQGEGP